MSSFEIAEKISKGKISKFLNDNSLLNQIWIMDPKKKVSDILNENSLNKPLKILVKEEELTLDGIKQYYVYIGNNDRYKFETLCDLYNRIISKFSVIQSIYKLPEDSDIYDNILKEEFPKLSDIKLNDYLEGYKIKYNVNDKLFFTPKNNHDLDIYKLYDYKKCLTN